MISLNGHPDPERFVAEFSGTDRAIGEYLMAEMLERLRNMVMSAGELNLRVFFERARSRRELVVTFLSVLELVRSAEVNLFQEQTFGDIVARVAS